MMDNEILRLHQAPAQNENGSFLSALVGALLSSHQDLWDNHSSSRRMTLGALIQAVELAITFASIILIADIIVHYVLDPFHPVREALDAMVNPFLNPIRRILPPTGMIDLSPIILYFLIRLVGGLLINVISSIA